METTYKKLWKILIDRDMSKSELRERAHLSSVTLAKLGKGERRCSRRSCCWVSNWVI